MSNIFTITVPGPSQDHSYKVFHEMSLPRFHRFQIIASNAVLIFDRNIDSNPPWNQVGGRIPKTEAGKLHLQKIVDALESHLRNRSLGNKR